MTINANIITATTAYRMAIKAIAVKTAIAEINKDSFKVLYVNHSNYGKILGEDFANHPDMGNYTTALKFKAVVNLVQNGDLWLDLPAARAAALGLDRPGSWVFCSEDISLEEALTLVKASEKESITIKDAWRDFGISDDGYIVDEDGEEIMYPIPPTKALVEWLSR